MLSAEGLVTLQRVMHDGTKVKACAGADSFRREGKIRAPLELARQPVKEMGELAPGMDKVEENLGRQPGQAVVDGGFTSRETILDMDQRGVDLIGSLGDGAGQSAAQMERRGVDPAFRPQAFPYHPESDTYTAWIKDKMGLRRFRLRGLLKVSLEVVWACLTYNIKQGIRLRWRREIGLATA